MFFLQGQSPKSLQNGPIPQDQNIKSNKPNFPDLNFQINNTQNNMLNLNKINNQPKSMNNNINNMNINNKYGQNINYNINIPYINNTNNPNNNRIKNNINNNMNNNFSSSQNKPNFNTNFMFYNNNNNKNLHMQMGPEFIKNQNMMKLNQIQMNGNSQNLSIPNRNMRNIINNPMNQYMQMNVDQRNLMDYNNSNFPQQQFLGPNNYFNMVNSIGMNNNNDNNNMINNKIPNQNMYR